MCWCSVVPFSRHYKDLNCKVSPGHPGSKKVPTHNIITYPSMSRTPGKVDVQDIQFCLCHLALDTNFEFRWLTYKVALPSRGLMPAARLPLSAIPPPLALPGLPCITVTNRPFLRGMHPGHISPSSAFCTWLNTHSPQTRRQKHVFSACGIVFPHFTETLHNSFELIYLASVP